MGKSAAIEKYQQHAYIHSHETSRGKIAGKSENFNKFYRLDTCALGKIDCFSILVSGNVLNRNGRNRKMKTFPKHPRSYIYTTEVKLN